MRLLFVDFKSRGGPHRMAWAIAGGIAVVALVIMTRAWHEERRIHDLRNQIESKIQASATVPVRPSSVSVRRVPYDTSAREMLMEATSNWPAMLTALEAVAFVGVTPAVIEVIPAERQIRVEVQFSDYARLLEYLAELNAGEPVPRWKLMQAQTSKQTGGGVEMSSSPSVASVRGEW